jgi:hypothetical protein
MTPEGVFFCLDFCLSIDETNAREY